MNNMPNAWVHRVSPSNIDQLQSICLPNDLIVTGWSAAEGLEKVFDWGEAREIIKRACYPKDDNYRRAGGGTASMWKFIHEMKPGDYVLVPYRGGVFYVAEITGDLVVDRSPAATEADSVYRRPVRWLNAKQPIPRDYVKSGLRSRLKIRQTTVAASEFVGDVVNALGRAASGKAPDREALFPSELRQKLIKATLDEIHSGYMDERKFEQLVAAVLRGMGARECKIIPRQRDNGVDVRAEFAIGPTEIVVGAQVKWHKGRTESRWLDHFVKGLKAEGITIGWFITAAEFSDDFEDRAKALSEQHGCELHVISGSEFAAMVVDYSVSQRSAA